MKKPSSLHANYADATKANHAIFEAIETLKKSGMKTPVPIIWALADAAGALAGMGDAAAETLSRALVIDRFEVGLARVKKLRGGVRKGQKK